MLYKALKLLPDGVLPCVIALPTAASQPIQSLPQARRSGYQLNPNMNPLLKLWAGPATQEIWPLAPCATWRGSSPFPGWRLLWKHTSLREQRFQLSSLKWRAG